MEGRKLWKTRKQEEAKRALSNSDRMQMVVREERAVLQELEKGIAEHLPEIIDEIPAENYQIPTHLQLSDEDALDRLWHFEVEEGHITDLVLFECVKLPHLPASIGQLQHLRSLSITDDWLAALPESIGQLRSLQEFNLSSLELKVLPASFGDLQALQSLSIECRQLTTLPESFGRLHSLKTLKVWSNSLLTLPESFGNLQALESLELICWKLKTLPDSFGNLKSLQKLKSNVCNLKNFPQSFWKFII